MDVVRFRGTVRFPFALVYAQFYVGLIAVFAAVIATVPSMSAVVITLVTPPALLATWFAGVLYRPCLDVEADESGLTIGRWQQRRFAWREVAGIVLHGERTLRIVVVDRSGQLRAYGCTAQKRADQLAAPLFHFAAERVRREAVRPPEWDGRRFARADALSLAAFIVAPALVIIAVARPWGAFRWLSPVSVYIGLVAVLHSTMSFRLPFSRRARGLLGAGQDVVALAAWREAAQQHRDAEYR